jgi:hypothetical protein
MTDVAIHTNASGLVAVYTPSHRLIYFAPHAMHLANIPVTGGAIYSSLYVRLVRVICVRFRFEPVHALPGRLLFSLREGGQLLNFGALGLDGLVATHTRADVGNSRVGRLIHVLVAESAFELWGFFAWFGYVLPVIELDWLKWRLGFGDGSEHKEADDCDHRDCQHYEFCQSSHPSG